MIQPADLDNIAVAILAMIGVMFHFAYLIRAIRAGRGSVRGVAVVLKVLSIIALAGVVTSQALVIADAHSAAERELIRWTNALVVLAMTGGAVANRGPSV